jgi:hypothetical protein
VATGRCVAAGLCLAVAVGVGATVVLLASGAGTPEAMTSGVISALITLIPLSIDARRPR